MKQLAIIGYGKMGRMVDQLAAEYGFEVAARIDMNDPIDAAANADAAIEFSTPDAAPANLIKLAALKVPTVCGTTAWLKELPEVEAAVNRHQATLVYSPNFSVGVNIFVRAVAETARLMANQPEYGAWAWEMHHDAKKDAPSGTLIKLVDEMKAAGYARNIDVASNRAGRVPGTHEIGFDSAADTITLRHTARSREGFARGALQAARWLAAKPRKGVFEFSKILFEE